MADEGTRFARSVPPFAVDQDFTLYVGDSRKILTHFEDASVNCVITSPPYWRMRDYQAKGQIGWERSVVEYGESIVETFAELKRVLRPDGVVWINLGDKFKNKRLLGIPHLVREMLEADGWFYRMEVVWEKLNVRPESANDRPTHSHEFLFMLTRGPRYWYDKKAIEEPAEWARWGDQTVPKYQGTKTATGWMEPKTKVELSQRTTRNKRSVWSLPTANYPGSHDAVFPAKLIEPCVLSSCPPGGVVLDPFLGSGTTAVVALSHGRRAIGIELSKKAARQAVIRVGKEARNS